MGGYAGAAVLLHHHLERTKVPHAASSDARRVDHCAHAPYDRPGRPSKVPASAQRARLQHGRADMMVAAAYTLARQGRRDTGTRKTTQSGWGPASARATRGVQTAVASVSVRRRHRARVARRCRRTTFGWVTWRANTRTDQDWFLVDVGARSRRTKSVVRLTSARA